MPHPVARAGGVAIVMAVALLACAPATRTPAGLRPVRGKRSRDMS